MINEAPVGDYWDTFCRFRCPGCLKLNLVDEGNMQDLSQMDAEAAICWNCGLKFWLDYNIKKYPEDYGYDSENVEENQDIIEIVETVKGLKKINNE